MTKSQRAPSSRPVLPADFVAGYKRRRVAQATADCAREVGLGGLSVSMIVKRCRIARATFYSLFEGKDAAVEFACRAATDALTEAIRSARVDSGADDRAAAAIDAFLDAVGENPHMAELCLVHCGSPCQTESGDRYRDEVVRALAEAFGSGKTSGLAAAAVTETVALRLARGALAEIPGSRDALVELARS